MMKPKLIIHRGRWRPVLGQVTMAVVCLVCGCSTHEEEDDHHLEHLIPAHKPANFAKAVEQLRSRGLPFFEGKSNEEEQGELVDIIDWLPELAADSDLKRSHWEQVQQETSELLEIINSERNAESQQEWGDLISRLEALIPFSDTSSKSQDQSANPTPEAEKVQHD